MKHTPYILLLWMLLATLPLRAASLAEADEAYIAGNYEQAIASYQAVLDEGMHTPDLYYNLGNAYFRTGKLADAILQYERTLRLDATHADAKHNLAFAQAMTVDKIDPIGTIFLVEWWATACRWLTPTAWAVSSILLFVLCLASVGCFVFAKPVWLRKTGFSVAIVALFLSVLTAFCANFRQNEIDNTSQAIVYVPTVTTKSSPDKSGNDLFILHEGTKVTIKSTLGEWSEIQTADGNTGWLLTSTIAVI